MFPVIHVLQVVVVLSLVDGLEQMGVQPEEAEAEDWAEDEDDAEEEEEEEDSGEDDIMEEISS